MNRRNLLLGGFAVIGLGGWYLTSGMGSNSTPISSASAGNSASSGNSGVDTSGVADMVIGNPDAAVTVIEYASFTCPHCADFHAGSFKKLKAEFIDTGKIKFIYREVYFDRPGLWASMVARCGGAEKFYGISNLIYKSQSLWTRAGDPAAIADELAKIGRLAGLENDKLGACMQDSETAEALNAWFEYNKNADDITSTPSFIINGQKYSNMAYDEMKGIIDKALES